MEDLEEILRQYKISAENFKEISNKLKPLTLKKGDIFIEAGKQNRKIGILINGLMVATYISEKGKEEISRFYHNSGNRIVSNHESFYFDKLSTETIKAFEETHIFYISKSDLNEIYQKYPEFEKIARVLAEESYINAIARIQDLQSLTGKERVAKFIKTNNCLLQKVNRQDVASYLGINRNDFSKYLKEN